MNRQHQIEQYLERLGIALDVSHLYLELARHQQPSVLQLAKSLGISRTQTYRHLDILQAHNLVSAEKVGHTTRYHTLPLDSVEGVIASRQADLSELQQGLGNMAQLMREFVTGTHSQTIARHYYGYPGIKQANWNLTKAEGEYRVFEVDHLPKHLDKAFAWRCNARMKERKLESYDLTNKQQINLEDLEPYDKTRLHYQYIDPGILAINFEMYLYNDVVTLLDYDPENMHAIEIQHPTLYAMMRQLYEVVWSLGRPIVL